ncbi:MAG: ATP synthase subunit I [Jatrophihabitantaceae bacterium]
MEPAVYTPVSAAANLRRSAVVGAALGAVAIVIASLNGHPLMGVFGLVGIALGALNNRMLQVSVIAYAQDQRTMTKKRFRNGVFARLGGITILAIAICLLIRPDGLGVFAGLAVFQILMLVGAAVPVFRSLRPSR